MTGYFRKQHRSENNYMRIVNSIIEKNIILNLKSVLNGRS